MRPQIWKWLVGGGLLMLAIPGISLAADEANNATGRVEKQKELVVRRLNKLDDGTVYGNDGKKIGHMNTIAIDAARGRIAYAVVEFDRLADISDKLFAVPWSALDKKLDEKNMEKITYAMNADKEQLTNAKGFDKNNWPDMADAQWGRDVHTAWNVQPYWEEERHVTVHAPGVHVDVNAGKRERENEKARIQGTPVSADRGMLVRSGDLVGHNVLDRDGAKIADINTVMVDVHSGRFVNAIIDTDRYAEKNAGLAKGYFHPVPWQLFEVTATDRAASDKAGALLKNREAFKVVMSTPLDKVKAAPQFGNREWPDMTQQWNESVYSAYGVQPFWTGGSTGARSQ